MKVEIHLCDLCEAHLNEGKTGYSINIQSSEGGWGRVGTACYFSGEVCPKCAKEFDAITAGVRKWIDTRASTRAPKIIIQDPDNITVTTDDKSLPA